MIVRIICLLQRIKCVIMAGRLFKLIVKKPYVEHLMTIKSQLFIVIQDLHIGSNIAISKTRFRRCFLTILGFEP